jgi:hypothetical protein
MPQLPLEEHPTARGVLLTEVLHPEPTACGVLLAEVLHPEPTAWGVLLAEVLHPELWGGFSLGFASSSGRSLDDQASSVSPREWISYLAEA